MHSKSGYLAELENLDIPWFVVKIISFFLSCFLSPPLKISKTEKDIQRAVEVRNYTVASYFCLFIWYKQLQEVTELTKK